MSPQAGWNLQAKVRQSAIPRAIHYIGAESPQPGWQCNLGCAHAA